MRIQHLTQYTAPDRSIWRMCRFDASSRKGTQDRMEHGVSQREQSLSNITKLSNIKRRVYGNNYDRYLSHFGTELEARGTATRKCSKCGPIPLHYTIFHIAQGLAILPYIRCLRKFSLPGQ